MQKILLAAILLLFLIADKTHAQAGALDTTFNAVGSVVYAPGTNSDIAQEVTALPDTSILVVSNDFIGGRNTVVVTHIFANGQLDSTYGVDSARAILQFGASNTAYDIQLLPTGKVLVSGAVSDSIGADVGVLIARLNVNGTIDSSFNGVGYVNFQATPGSDMGYALNLYPNGRFLVSGYGTPAGGVTRDCMFARFHADGSIDSTFGTNGVTFISIPSNNEVVNDAAFMDDGSISAVGSASQGGSRVMITRLDSLGHPILMFNGSGYVNPTLPGTTSTGMSIAVNGHDIFFCGSATISGSSDAYIASISDSFAILNGWFGTAGKTVVNKYLNDYGYDLYRQPDGKLLMCGSTGNSGLPTNRKFLLVRFTPTGIPDTTFGTNGLMVNEVSTTLNDDANAVTLAPDGKIILAGYTQSAATNNDVAVCRYFNDINSSATGVVTIDKNQSPFTVYPVPAHSKVVYIRGAFENSIVKYSIFDLQGKCVLQSQTATMNDLVEVHLDGIQEGVYLLRADGGTQHFSGKIVLQ